MFLPCSPWVFKVIPQSKIQKVIRGCWIEFLYPRLKTQELNRVESSNSIKCINNSFDAHRTASASFVFNKTKPQINRVLTGIEALVSHYVALNRTPSWPEESSIIWADCPREDSLRYGSSGLLRGLHMPKSCPSVAYSHSNQVGVSGESWWAGWRDNSGPGHLRPPVPCFQGLLILCCINAHFVVLRAFYCITTKPHQVSTVITIPDLWIRKPGVREV